jgi:phosphoribosylanthranilate isomerase
MAAACATLKIEAIGLVFYPKSPRYVSDAQGKEIAAAVDGRAAVIGVFVDEPAEVILKKAERCGLTGVQLHGRETPAEVTQLKNTGLTVIKALFQKREPSFKATSRYGPSAFLLECGRGRLPGGTARTWDWADAQAIAANAPVILAGGLTPENVGQAVRLGRPHAVDVSSGVETSPGKKDLAKIKAFVSAVAGIVPTDGDEKARRIFQ